MIAAALRVLVADGKAREPDTALGAPVSEQLGGRAA